MFEIPIDANLSEGDKISWLRLARTHNIGRSTLLNLVNVFGNIDDALNNAADFSIKGGSKKPIQINSLQTANKEYQDCLDFGAQIICFSDAKYPELLRHIPDPPTILTAKGDVDLMHKNSAAIVGPRNASTNGCAFAKKMAYELGNKGLVINSGLARGIDGAAHSAAIKTGTVGVIAGGIDNIYPKENANLYREIFENGLIVTETPIKMPPKGGNFPQRNRIISGISLGVVVIEATLRSGTLITARFALEQDREIFAVPGSPFDPRCEGTNRLIKQGARLVQNSDDIFDELNELISNRESHVKINDSFEVKFTGPKLKIPDEDIVGEARKLILEKSSYAPINVETLINELEIPVKIASIALIQLELAEKIERKNGKISLLTYGNIPFLR